MNMTLCTLWLGGFFAGAALACLFWSIKFAKMTAEYNQLLAQFKDMTSAIAYTQGALAGLKKGLDEAAARQSGKVRS